MWEVWKLKQDRASLRFGTVAATVYNAVQAFGSKSATRKLFRWTDIFPPRSAKIESSVDDSPGPMTYEELKAKWKADPEAAKRQSNAAKQESLSLLDRFRKVAAQPQG
jgi:hypothetical protein